MPLGGAGLVTDFLSKAEGGGPGAAGALGCENWGCRALHTRVDPEAVFHDDSDVTGNEPGY